MVILFYVRRRVRLVLKHEPKYYYRYKERRCANSRFPGLECHLTNECQNKRAHDDCSHHSEGLPLLSYVNGLKFPVAKPTIESCRVKTSVE